jgi:hypothetical protein
MVTCRSCSRKLRDSDRFCDACGLPQHQTTTETESPRIGSSVIFDKDIELAKLLTKIAHWNSVYATILAVSLSLLIVSVALTVADLLTKPDGRLFWLAVAIWIVMVAVAFCIMLEAYRRNSLLQRRFVTEFGRIYREERVNYYSEN